MHLLDVNVLIARCDPAHEHHQRAVRWFSDPAREGWATCPLTENGFVRVLGHPSYPGGPGTPARAATILRRLTASVPRHRFLPDSISILDAASFPDLREVTSKQLTDLYLLALAVHNDLKLVTFDRRIDAASIPGGVDAHQVA